MRRWDRRGVRPSVRSLAVILFTCVGAWLAASISAQSTWTPLPVADDPLVRMPGTQPGVVTLENPATCLTCHAGSATSTQPGFLWRGSMMAHAARDFLFWPALAVAVQDSIWAFGRPNVADTCLRCHSPKGWLEGRSDPVNGSLLTGADFDGVQCDFCHRKVDPFFQATFDGTREGGGTPAYWDETNASPTPSQAAANLTYTQDRALSATFTFFGGDPLYNPNTNLPVNAAWDEDGSGQYFIATGTAKRAPFADPVAPHPVLDSRHHKSRFFCSTCHDVSNPALANMAFDGASPGDPNVVLPTEQTAAYGYFHEQRVFSEFLLSDFGLDGGATGSGAFAPGLLITSDPGARIRSCQDCHMRWTIGTACSNPGARFRPLESQEHPRSGMPRHELTGGNAWVPRVLASTVLTSPNYDATNDSLLNQGPGALTLDLSQGLGIDPEALLDGAARAEGNLREAATIQNVTYDPPAGALSFLIRNNTGHKLITGYPEGRRMFVNIRAYAGAALLAEINPYDPVAGTLKGLPGSAGSPPLGAGESYDESLVYQVRSGSGLTGEAETLHIALATSRVKDNRIPPRGFRIAEAPARQSEPVWQGASSPGHFTAEEYAGGYDQVSVSLPPGADRVEIRLYYQTTSREYVEFLRDEIKGTGNTLSSPTLFGLPDAYIAQSDPFFAGLKAWGDTIWQIWDHNKNLPGAAPILMDEAVLGRDMIFAAPLDGSALDCRDPENPATLPTFAWDGGGYDGFRVFLARDPSFSAGLKITSGSDLLKIESWQPSKKKWKRICGKPGEMLYATIFGVDRDLGKQDPARTAYSAVLEVRTLD